MGLCHTRATLGLTEEEGVEDAGGAVGPAEGRCHHAMHVCRLLVERWTKENAAHIEPRLEPLLNTIALHLSLSLSPFPLSL
jgi:hypothetical protein